jgi:DNA replication initiation complex subunit (GINS family)
MPEALGYDDLRKILGKERRTPLLTKVRPDFYNAVSELVSELMKVYEEENRKDPTSSKTMILHEELRKVRDLGREIFDHRIDKITRIALTAAGGETVDGGALVEGEKEVYDRLVATLSRSYADLMGMDRGSYRVVEQPPRQPVTPSPAPEPKAGPAPSTKDDLEEAPNGEGATTPAAEIPKEDRVDDPLASSVGPPSSEQGATEAKAKKKAAAGHTMVQILEDLPPFKGLDRNEYNLKKKDVISLPTAIADNLVKAKKAKHVQIH